MTIGRNCAIGSHLPPVPDARPGEVATLSTRTISIMEGRERNALDEAHCVQPVACAFTGSFDTEWSRSADLYRPVVDGQA